MRRLISILVLCVGILTSASAQTFTQRLQKQVSGQGTVVVHQSDSIDRLVNTAVLGNQGTKPVSSPTAKPASPDQPAASAAAATPATAGQNAQSTEQTEEGPKVVRGYYKTTGYRVQAFAGGNSRADRQRAEATRNNIKAHFPNVPVYVHFFSPRWICRVGNYRTYEEAHQMATSLKNLGFNQCTIVKGKIQVAY